MLKLICLAIFIACAAATAPVVISFDSFTDFSGWSLNGYAGAGINPNSDSALELTSAGGSEGSSAFLLNPVSLVDDGGFKASFSTAFAFRITNSGGIGDEDGIGADGIVFVINTVSFSAGGAGGSMGYGGIPDSVGIEFDTFNNGYPTDIDGNHVGVDLQGSVVSQTSIHYPFRFNDGNVHYAWVDYNGDTQLLEVRVAETSDRPNDALISYNVDLVAILKQPNAYIGFSSGTGGGWGKHEIIAWKFTNTYAPIFKNCDPTITGESSSSAVIETIDAWGYEYAPQYRVSVKITVTEPTLENWRLVVSLPGAATDGIVHYGTYYEVYTAGKFVCGQDGSSGTPAQVTLGAQPYANSLVMGDTVNVEYVATNIGGLSASALVANTKLSLMVASSPA